MAPFFFCRTQYGISHPHFFQLFLKGPVWPACIEYPSHVPMELVLASRERGSCILICGIETIMAFTEMRIARLSKNKNKLDFFNRASCAKDASWDVTAVRVPSHYLAWTGESRTRSVRGSQYLGERRV